MDKWEVECKVFLGNSQAVAKEDSPNLEAEEVSHSPVVVVVSLNQEDKTKCLSNHNLISNQEEEMVKETNLRN